MKKLFIVPAMLMAFGLAHAQDTGAPTTTPPAKSDMDHPCAAIENACKAGGYRQHDHKKDGKGLHKDCMRPFLKTGTAPSGVDMSGVTPEQVNACKMKKEEHHAKKKAAKAAK